MQTFQRAAVVLACAALASLTLIAAGCGSDSPGSGVAQAPTTPTTTQPSQTDGPSSGNPAAFSACMRSHGVPDFPDPRATGGGEVLSIPDSDSPRFESALRTCRKYLPDGGVPSAAREEQTALLRFAACMRAHGVPKFPDPTVTGGRASFDNSEIDRRSPRFAAAKKACAPELADAADG